jgi:hypothetical protein
MQPLWSGFCNARVSVSPAAARPSTSTHATGFDNSPAQHSAVWSADAARQVTPDWPQTNARPPRAAMPRAWRHCHKWHVTASAYTTETNRIQLVLFGKQNWTFGPYLAAICRLLISVME